MFDALASFIGCTCMFVRHEKNLVLSKSLASIRIVIHSCRSESLIELFLRQRKRIHSLKARVRFAQMAPHSHLLSSQCFTPIRLLYAFYQNLIDRPLEALAIIIGFVLYMAPLSSRYPTFHYALSSRMLWSDTTCIRLLSRPRR